MELTTVTLKKTSQTQYARLFVFLHDYSMLQIEFLGAIMKLNVNRDPHIASSRPQTACTQKRSLLARALLSCPALVVVIHGEKCGGRTAQLGGRTALVGHGQLARPSGLAG
ncbi:MAG: hypothetical protein GY820_02405 [Gammaproteobacteria bacterium]|nr:hypothetical protein [Gammaproteobacteria bacterium]